MIPLLPLAAAGCGALCRQSQRRLAAGLAIGSMALAFVLSLVAWFHAIHAPYARQVLNFDWFELGTGAVSLGVVLDPLGATMV